ncbi:MAG: hypothetical protein ACI8XM_000399, partial [Haloarculaceae archaeon]
TSSSSKRNWVTPDSTSATFAKSDNPGYLIRIIVDYFRIAPPEIGAYQ